MAGAARFTDKTLWPGLHAETTKAFAGEPVLEGIFSSVLDYETFDDALAATLARRIATSRSEVPRTTWFRIFRECCRADQKIGMAARADLIAAMERDPAILNSYEPLLFFKGYAALQTYRMAHYLVSQKRRDAALELQSLSSGLFGVDIHPAAKIGKGILLDHAHNIVVGETAVIEDDVTMYQGVTLGGNGNEIGDRHPKIRHGVMIGAGAKILGNIVVGACVRVAAGSVVLENVPHHKVVAGVPARIVGDVTKGEPARDCEQALPGDMRRGNL